MTAPEISYITAAEVKEHSLVTGLIALTDANIEKLIRLAEDQIDIHVGPQRHHRCDENTDRVFPREEDFDEDFPNTPVIPYKVSMACLRQVEWLYTQWWNTATSSLLPMTQEVSEEEIRGDGGYRAVYGREGTSASKTTLCSQAQEYLKGFVARTVAIGVSDPDHIPPPT